VRLFHDRVDAGRQLAGKLTSYAGRPDVVVLGLARGGVAVAAQVAQALAAPMDVLVVRKLSVPGHEELAMGAVASGGAEVLDQEVVRHLGIGDQAVRLVAARELSELERRQRVYRDRRAALPLAGKVVILIDDGLATGSSMRAAVKAVRAQGPSRVVVATPVASAETCSELGQDADEIVCGETPAFFTAVRQWYEDFSPTTDEEVRAALVRTAAPAKDPAPPAAAPPLPPPVDPDLASVEAVRRSAWRLRDDRRDFDELLQRMGQARVVLIGEATHGTHDFYRTRIHLTRRLVVEHGFRAVAVEADWPDAYRVNRYVRDQSPDAEAVDALADFARFPTWMWRNADVLEFVGWLRDHNDRLADDRDKVGFYGLDLYSLFTSMQAVVAYLERVDPPAAARARQRYACFDHFGADSQKYGFSAALKVAASCEDQVVAQLADMRRYAGELGGGGPMPSDESFFAEQNARVVKNAEQYYRAMFRGRVSSWNLRDQHMMETLQALLAQLDRDGGGEGTKLVVWAHNSHLGDARATDMAGLGELNLGQLVRQAFRRDSFSLGFTTYEGTVTAASEWDEPAERKRVRPALARSYEAIFHETGLERFVLMFGDDTAATAPLRERRLERAIGVVYLPETERLSHYFEASLPDQFDAVIHLDETRAVEPLERTATWRTGELPETYPSAV
jgi:erythromycin esterase-like protein/predicted phosphoribosyltransferase